MKMGDSGSVHSTRNVDRNSPNKHAPQVPKWLEEFTSTLTREYLEEPTKRVAEARGHPYTATFNSSNIPERIPYLEGKISRPLSTSTINSAKFGRRSSITQDLYKEMSPKHLTVTQSEYIVPKIDGQLEMDAVAKPDRELEISWRSLHEFNQSHKGRLPSNIGNWGDRDKLLPGSSNSSLPVPNELTSGRYRHGEPHLTEDPKERCKSEMSNDLPTYEYGSVRRAAEKHTAKTRYRYKSPHPCPIAKSRSSDTVFENILNDSLEDLSISSSFSMSKDFKSLNNFERRMSDYHLRLAEEDRMRKSMIDELLFENERITSDVKCENGSNLAERRTSFPQDQNFYREPVGLKKNHYNVRDDFVIPELPKGKVLTVDILSTWGDKYYVGLNGIEIFNDEGEVPKVKQIAATPSDVNILPECQNDPRVVSNLLDGVNRTNDDLHIWLAPFSRGKSHIINIEFSEYTTIGMIRIWNYNKSRIHSYRGARDIIMLMDGEPIFKGEIAKACGAIRGGVHHFGDTILFTTDDIILEKISINDTSFPMLLSQPDTADRDDYRPPTSILSSEVRPVTGISSALSEKEEEPQGQIVLGAKSLHLVLVENWGNPLAVGLTGIEIIEGTDNVLSIEERNLTSNTKCSRLKNLINGENVTTASKNMWCVSLREENVVISVSFDDFKYISGIRLWNYNENLELSYAGVKTLKIFLDDQPVINPIFQSDYFLLRRAPGHSYYDFVQDIRFFEQPAERGPSLFDSTLDCMFGFVMEIVVYSTWGDQYYCGLNGIELYDPNGQKIRLNEQSK